MIGVEGTLGDQNAMRQALAEEIELVQAAIRLRTGAVEAPDEWLNKLFEWHDQLKEALEQAPEKVGG